MGRNESLVREVILRVESEASCNRLARLLDKSWDARMRRRFEPLSRKERRVAGRAVRLAQRLAPYCTLDCYGRVLVHLDSRTRV
jgi:hypothetical protein